jgi:di/tricarboxylate transporter
MESQLLLVLLLLVSAIIMFVMNRPRMDAVGLIMLTALPFTGTITMPEALAGFSDSNIILIAALFVIGSGLVRTGVARRLGDWLTSRAGGSEVKLLVLLMLVVCGLGSFMSSTAVTAIFIPVALRIAQSTGTPASRLMMPISMAALISGMMTLVATAPNLVVNSEMVRQGSEGFGFFSFTSFGAPILVLGILYMLVARRWLNASPDVASLSTTRPSLREWISVYKLQGREHRLRITGASSLAGMTVEQAGNQAGARATIVAIERGTEILMPTDQTKLEVGDVILLDICMSVEGVDSALQRFALERLALVGPYFTDRSQDVGMAEVVVPATSDLIGQTIADAKLRDTSGLTVIGLRRGLDAVEGDLCDQQIALGDTLLVSGLWRSIQNVQQQSRQLVVLNLPAELDEVLPVARKAPQAVFCLAVVVGLMVSGIVSNVQAALIGCLMMGAMGIMNLTSAYRSIDWKTIVLIAGMMPFSLALQRTGGVELAAEGLMSVIGESGPHVILAILFAMTAMLGMFISNTATAILMAPVALAVASELNASPYPFGMTVALAASTAFMTPVSSPVNTLVVTPGNYKFSDFVKIGVPFSILVLIVCVLLIPWLLPLYPAQQ